MTKWKKWLEVTEVDEINVESAQLTLCFRVLAFKLTCNALLFFFFFSQLGESIVQGGRLSALDSCSCHNYPGRRAPMWAESLQAAPFVKAAAQNQFVIFLYLLSSS